MGRPVPEWNGFLGQGAVVRPLAALAEGAKAIGVLMPSIMLIGNSGLGKTALARAVANAYGATLHVVIANKDLNFDPILDIFRSGAHADILFIDECHALKCDVQEYFYSHLDTLLSSYKVEVGNSAPIQTGASSVPLKAFSFIAATDQPGTLTPAFKKRFCQIFELRPYSTREMIAIVRLQAARLNILISPHASRLLAQTCRGIPRRAEQRLICLKAFFGEEGRDEFDAPKITKFLSAMKIDERGLESADHRYLQAIFERGGEAASSHLLAAQIGCDIKYVLHDIEPYLLQCGFIDITSRGRILTSKGIAQLKGKSENENETNHNG